MISISVNIDPNNPDDTQSMLALSVMLATIATGTAPVVSAVEKPAAHIRPITPAKPAPAPTPIDPQDAPDAGVRSAADVFASHTHRMPDLAQETSAAAVFGSSPNVQAATAAASPIPATSTPETKSIGPAAQPDASATAANVLLDSTGLPWDARINASTRTMTQKGVWKALKGVDEETVTRVRAELRAALGAPPAPAFVPLNAAPAPVPPPPPPAPAAAAPAPAAATLLPLPTTFVEVCQYVTARGIAAPTVTAICEKFGLPGLGLLAVRPDLIAPIAAEFAAVQ